MKDYTEEHKNDDVFTRLIIEEPEEFRGGRANVIRENRTNEKKNMFIRLHARAKCGDPRTFYRISFEIFVFVLHFQAEV